MKYRLLFYIAKGTWINKGIRAITWLPNIGTIGVTHASFWEQGQGISGDVCRDEESPLNRRRFNVNLNTHSLDELYLLRGKVLTVCAIESLLDVFGIVIYRDNVLVAVTAFDSYGDFHG